MPFGVEHVAGPTWLLNKDPFMNQCNLSKRKAATSSKLSVAHGHNFIFLKSRNKATVERHALEHDFWSLQLFNHACSQFPFQLLNSWMN